MTSNDMHSDRTPLWIASALIGLTAAVFAPVANYDFIAFDDNEYVYENAVVMSGLTWDGMWAAFTETVSAHWHPLTVLSLMTDASLYGANAGGFHVTNLLLHIVNVVLLFFVLLAMTSHVWPSAIVASVFAVHPLHVEPVAWISSRKDVLSATFWLLAMAAYLRYVRAQHWRAFALVVACMGLGLLAKSILITLPLALLLLDYWPLRRISFDEWRTPPGRRNVGRVLTEKAALMPLAVVFVAINAAAQRSAGQVAGLGDVTLWDRVSNASVAYATYLYQSVWPRNLALYYPLPEGGYSFSLVAMSIAVLAVISLVALGVRRRHPATLVGWLWFIGVLGPVSGIVQLGAQAHADRYMYLPLIGLTVAVVWPLWNLAQHLLSRSRSIGSNIPLNPPSKGDLHPIRKRSPQTPLEAGIRGVFATGTVAVVAIFAIVSATIVPHWRNSESAFQHALSVTSDNYLVHYNYGVALESDGRIDEATAQYDRALAAHPGHSASHINAGALRARTGDYERAIAHFQAALSSDPDNATALCNLAVALMESGQTREALAPLRHAMAVAPDAPRTQQTARLVMAAQPAGDRNRE